MPRLLIVADDLTGALDAAGPFASRGIATACIALPEAGNAAAASAAAVVAVNTESRHLSPPAAAQRVRDAWAAADGARFDIVVKKVDSTLRGPVVAELAALRDCSGRTTLVCATAFPAQGRTVVGGDVRVHGTPLRDTGFARDALSPALAQPLAAALRHAGVHDCEVLDATDDATLDTIAATHVTRGADVLLAGSAGLTAALARAWADAASVAGGLAPIDAPLLFVIGSRAEASRVQAERLAMAGVDVIDAPDGHVPAGGLPAGDLVLRATRGAERDGADAAAVAARLAHGTLALVDARPVGAIVATGGDTAVALLRAAGQPQVDVLAELLPGIAVARLVVAGRTLPLVTKAGGFGAPDALVRIRGRLRGTTAVEAAA
ncbi:MAG: hypothetical protein MUF30_02560 [Burkholderiales bacterium]|jgi:uncharacterized protein YgbK (DUF1537 family)|nr:hypothetical protein [Burkholderiales bacterium]